MYRWCSFWNELPEMTTAKSNFTFLQTEWSALHEAAAANRVNPRRIDLRRAALGETEGYAKVIVVEEGNCGAHRMGPSSEGERVLTIDHDNRIDPRPPFERLLAVQQQTVSDIQAFGYTPDNAPPSAPGDKPLALWCLVRQDLFLNEQLTAFLIVHWKHTFDAIHLLDVIPGDRTELINV